ncbi:MAG: HAD family phosphatase [Clostridiales bacterium]|nr:HAD family phosphatase [Clostridiales bacterium]
MPKYDREKTLFVTDFDGTLLDPDAQINRYTADVLREAVSRGYNIAVATGRLPSSPKTMFEQQNIPMNLPVIGRNGVLVLDTKRDKYLQMNTLPRASAERVLELMREHGTKALLIDSVDPSGAKKALRRGAEGFSENPDERNEVFYIAADGSRDELAPVFEQALRLPGVGGVLSAHDYIPGLWYAEFFSEKASKGNGVSFIKEKYDFLYAVCFGDNLNDISMFEVCDEGYAPENAVFEVKAAASAVIGSNASDGVAWWIEENLLN